MKLFLLFFFILTSPVYAKGNLSNDQIKQQIIQESMASYSGRCPCPYNIAKNGSQCGGRSAYSRPGGVSPICYPEDISPKMIQEFRRRNGY